MSLDLCYSHIRAGDRCAIYVHVICVSENDSIGGLQVRIHLGAKKKKNIYIYNFSILEGLVSLSPYCF